MKLKIIFLDIDGVLNPHWRKKWDKKAIAIFNRMVFAYDLRIVITSTWRLNHTREQLETVFKEQGIPFPIHDFTSVIEGIRGQEIMKYIESYDIKDFAVLDDVIYNITPYIPETDQHRILKCRSDIGIEESHFEAMRLIYSV